ncbi:MAG: single-stranded DNA-binding protein [Candidatus Sericytochromatia bacterium]|nr:single-stranded DNA-binding protein [Candidatus Sericytochromatia bacterium]
MAANNTLMIIGRVGKDPETRYFENGRAVSKFSLAVNRPVKDKQGNEMTDWFSVDIWGKQAELASELIRKGMLISVSGACHVDEWTDPQGVKQKMVKVAADSFQLLESRAVSESRDAGERVPALAGSRSTVPNDELGGDLIHEDDIPPF